MRKLLEAYFPHCASKACIDVEKSPSIIVHDDEASGRSKIYRGINLIEYPRFTIKNSALKDIHLLSIDNCIFFSHDGGKCDFALFDEKKFVFVEIKKGSGSNENRSNKKLDAIFQLKATLNKFKHFHFGKFRVFACMCVGYFEQSPAAAASDLDLLVEFINDYNVELIEGNEFEFD